MASRSVITITTSIPATSAARPHLDVLGASHMLGMGVGVGGTGVGVAVDVGVGVGFVDYFSATVCRLLALMADQVSDPICVGVFLSSLVPSPSWP